MNYDKTIKIPVSDEALDYGIIFGNEKIVFIKSGAGSSIKGKNNKYLKMAHRISERLGATVICASNPDAKHSALDKQIIKKVADAKGFSHYEVYFVGTSDGGYKILEFAIEIPETVGLLGINASMKSLDDFKEKLLLLSHINKTLVYGTEDDLIGYLPELKELEGEKLKIITVLGANHKFRGKTEEFISLIDLL